MAQKLTYTQCGDYYIPDIRLEHTGIQTLGKYGRMYLQNGNGGAWAEPDCNAADKG